MKRFAIVMSAIPLCAALLRAEAAGKKYSAVMSSTGTEVINNQPTRATSQSQGNTSQWVIDHEYIPEIRKTFRMAKLKGLDGKIIKSIENRGNRETLPASESEVKDQKLLALAREEGLKFYRLREVTYSAYPVADGRFLMQVAHHMEFPPFPKATKPEHDAMLAPWSEPSGKDVQMEARVVVYNDQGGILWSRTFPFPVFRCNAEERGGRWVFFLETGSSEIADERHEVDETGHTLAIVPLLQPESK